MVEFKNYLNKFKSSDLTDLTSNVINYYIEGLKIKNTYLFTKSKEPKKNIARKLIDRVNHEFKCIKEHILKYCIVISQK
jgi:hypothetical protein